MKPSTRRVRASARWLVCCCVALRSVPASAQPSVAAPSRAEVAFAQAEALLAAGKAREACPLYEESHELDPQLGVLLYLADCREQNGELASAYRRFRQAQELAERLGDERVRIAAGRVARLAPRVHQIRLELPEMAHGRAAPPLSVYLDGELLPPASSIQPLLVDSGKHHVRVEAAGYRAFVTQLELVGEGQRSNVVVPPLEALPSDAAPAPPSHAPPSVLPALGVSLDPTPASAPPAPGMGSKLAPPLEANGASVRRGVAWTLAGVGGAGLVSAGVLSLMARGRYDSADSECARSCTAAGASTRAEARSLARAATLSGGVAVSALVGATLLWWTQRASSPALDPSELSVSAAKSEMSLSVRGRF